jgi:hypothetical protein
LTNLKLARKSGTVARHNIFMHHYSRGDLIHNLGGAATTYDKRVSMHQLLCEDDMPVILFAYTFAHSFKDRPLFSAFLDWILCFCLLGRVVAFVVRNFPISTHITHYICTKYSILFSTGNCASQSFKEKSISHTAKEVSSER